MAIKIYLLKLKRILQEVRKTFSIITFIYLQEVKNVLYKRDLGEKELKKQAMQRLMLIEQ